MARPGTTDQWQQLMADVGRLVAGRVPTRADVDDVVQEVLLRVWRHGKDLKNEERFGSWLSRIAYTATADHMRKRQRHPVRTVEPDQSAAPAQDGPLPEEAESQPKVLIADVLRPFVEALPSRYRVAVTLSELDGLSHAAVAERLGLSVSGVKSRVQRGREQLRRLLERCCQIALDARGAPLSCEIKPGAAVPPGCCENGCARPAIDVRPAGEPAGSREEN
jgi:RNA polymerase sigma-70 factor (ECF subfamily)